MPEEHKRVEEHTKAPEMPPPIAEAPEYTVDDEYESRNWLRIAGLAVLAIVAVVLIMLAARWLYRAISNNDEPSKTNTSQTTPTTTTQQNQSGTSQSTTSTSQVQGSTSSGTSSSTSSASATTLPNNGPGDTAAIFLGSVVVAATIHYGLGLRRQNQ
jgi:cytoskeletal protein RodZ